MIARTLDATFLNRVANDPAVRPMLGGAGPLDLTEIVGDPGNITLVSEHGGFILHRHEPGIYESHSLFLPNCGQEPVEAAREGFRYLFIETECLEVVTRVPLINKAALGLARGVGFQPKFERDAAWTCEDGTLTRVSYQGLTLERWMLRDGACKAAGEAFHDQLETAKQAAGSALDPHPEDSAHHHAAGAAMLMCLHGQAAKGVACYNRWARLAGYAPVTLLSEAPVVVDVIDAVVHARAGRMEVLSCR